MTLHHQTKTFLELLASRGEPPLEQMTPTEAREMSRKYYVASEYPIFASRDVNAGGVQARLYSPSSEKNLGLCVLFMVVVGCFTTWMITTIFVGALQCNQVMRF